MNSLLIALIAFASIFGGALLGFAIQCVLPDHHLRPESKDTVKLGAGLIATMAALVLGLLVSSSKSTYDSVNTGLIQMSAKAITLDRLLAQYGPETKEIRSELRDSVTHTVHLVWPELNSGLTGVKALEGSKTGERLAVHVRQLTPKSDEQRAIHAQSMQIVADIMQSKWVLVQQHHTKLPLIFLIILISWFAILNITYGIFAPRNVTVIAVLFFCALSVSASLLLIVEMNSPLDGLIKVSSDPMLNALKHLGE
ncbi:hypothetical protein [Geomonas sp.]|uniref:bestrophin-like domain n=1 Tax=Geomonas sp. TaxID=2651584 RepID=UPI002B479728|nr:hypothetical protein [Geomonas sp.]HJV35832.1 hypothetical protein [Geomonas sp.]